MSYSGDNLLDKSLSIGSVPERGGQALGKKDKGKKWP